MMNSSDLVLSPVNICGGFPISLSVPCIWIGAGGGGPPPGGPPLGGPPLGGPPPGGPILGGPPPGGPQPGMPPPGNPPAGGPLPGGLPSGGAGMPPYRVFWSDRNLLTLCSALCGSGLSDKFARYNATSSSVVMCPVSGLITPTWANAGIV
jgi:hypothetical protein